MASKEIRIETPFNIMQMGRWMKLQNEIQSFEEDEYEAKVVEIFSNITEQEAYDSLSYKSLQQAYHTILAELSKYHDNRPEPKKVLTIGGVKYKYMADLTELTVAERMDILIMEDKVFDMPNKLMSILYRNDDIRPREAEAIFAEKFPVKEFMIAWRFFFLKLDRWRNAIQVIQEARVEKLKTIERLMRMEQRLISASKSRRLFISWQIFSIEMWMRFKGWCILNFYSGKIFGRKSLNWIGRKLKFKR